MKILLAAVGAMRSKQKSEAADRLTVDYLHRCARYNPCEQRTFETESELLASLEQAAGRVPTYAILLDSGGQMLTSEQLAAHLGGLRDDGMQRLVLAIGPADGWSDHAKKRANLVFSLGRITLPHGLARAVLAEQVYRALTILHGHPYHSGH